MLAPTPVLRPSPLDIGALFSASFEVLKRRFGLVVLITLMPSLFMMAIVAVGIALMVPAFAAAANGSRPAVTAGLLVALVVMIVGIPASALLQLKSYGMLSLAAYEIAQGQHPDFRGVLARSRGFLPRMASVIAIGVVAGLLLAVVFFGAFFGLIAVIMSRAPYATESQASGAAMAAFGVFALLVLVTVPLGLILTMKLLYTVPAVALESLGGFEALKRSWTITRGAFWRTLGYYLVLSLAVGAVSYTSRLLSQLVLIPFGLSMPSIEASSDPSQALSMMAALVPMMLAISVIQLAVQVVILPFQQSYITYMFIDQVRRSEMPTAPPYGYPAAGYYAQPGQYYAQPQQQGYPAQWQADPGRSWQPPGWTPPDQAQPPQQWGQQYPPAQGWDGGQQGQQPPSGQGPTQG